MATRFCSTCKHHSTNCRHISHLLKVIADSSIDSLPPQLKVVAEFQVSSSKSHKNYAKVVSAKTIPFDLSNRLKHCLKTDYSKRFNIDGGIAHLYPPLPSHLICSRCATANSWSMEIALVKETFLVTPQYCHPAKGTANR